MDNRPIGIFDSGLGGLTAVRALRALLPEEDLVYFADSGRVPYGGRSVDQIRRMAVQDLELVAGFDVKAVLVACGTISSNAPDLLEQFRLPAFGVLRPGVEEMARQPGGAPLGVIATAASIRSGSFERALRAACPGREILAVPCPDFVPLIESGHTRWEDPLLREAVEKALAPLCRAGISALLLGCTHYGIIAEALSARLGPDVRLVDAAGCAAGALARMLRERELTGGTGTERYFTSGSAEDFAAAAATFLGRGIPPARELPPMPV